jgi:YkoY family integral membrane protein
VDVNFADLVTILLLVGLEGLLSADNALVLAILVLGLPRDRRRQALRYGLLGAFGMRIVTTLLAAYLIGVTFVKLVGAAYLLYLPYQHFFRGGDANDRRTPPKATAWLGLSAFWATVVKVELTNMVFSVDSILVAVAMSPKLWVVLTGGLLGIVAMRIVIGRLIALVERYPAVVDGAFVIIAWVGLKLLLEYGHSIGHVPWEIPQWLSLALIVTIFVGSLLYARTYEPAVVAHQRDEGAAQLLKDGDSDSVRLGDDDRT